MNGKLAALRNTGQAISGEVSNEPNQPIGLVIDGSGNVYTTGEFAGTADFDPGTITTNLVSAGSVDVFVSKLDASGDYVWAKKLGGTGIDAGYGIAADGSGNVYTTGEFGGTVDFDPGSGTSNLVVSGSLGGGFLQKMSACSSISTPLASATATQGTQPLSGNIQPIALVSSCDAIALVKPAGAAPVSGSVTASVYVQSMASTFNSQPYVRRYCDISPVTNLNTATATITLYFLQSDFRDYNSNRVSFPSLPVDGTDTSGYKANLRITQQHGTSATGAPGSYTVWAGDGRASVLITPTGVAYNTILARWEVTFPVTGFSGFFAHTGIATPLPVKLLSFTATNAGSHNRIDWTTATEDPGTRFELTRSSSNTFDKIGEAEGKGNDAAYTFYDEQPMNGVNYYRLKSTEADGGIKYSDVAVVSGNAKIGIVTVSPVPATSSIRITSSNVSLDGISAIIYNMQGMIVYSTTLTTDQTIDISSWAPGIYSLHLATRDIVRIVKQ